MTPDFDELVGADAGGEERERLRRAHERLVAAGPMPELPPALEEPPWPEAPRRVALRRRRVAGALALAAAIALLAFGGGYLTGRSGQPTAFDTDFQLVMRATPSAPGGAFASLRLGPVDDAGNWPMEMTVRGLPAAGRYELWLTRDGRRAASCGYFTVHAGETVVYLNAPYRLKRFDGWIVTSEVPGAKSAVVLST
jgi:hypothetical protein